VITTNSVRFSRTTVAIERPEDKDCSLSELQRALRIARRRDANRLRNERQFRAGPPVTVRRILVTVLQTQSTMSWPLANGSRREGSSRSAEEPIAATTRQKIPRLQSAGGCRLSFEAVTRKMGGLGYALRQVPIPTCNPASIDELAIHPPRLSLPLNTAAISADRA
jgi:hypothetical protein